MRVPWSICTTLAFQTSPGYKNPFMLLLISYTTNWAFGNVCPSWWSAFWIPSFHTPCISFLLIRPSLISATSCLTVPYMLTNISHNKETISYAGCVAQLTSSSWPWVLLRSPPAVMSFDRYVAICRPSCSCHHGWFCLRMIAFSWFTGFSNSVLVPLTLTCHGVVIKKWTSLFLWGSCPSQVVLCWHKAFIVLSFFFSVLIYIPVTDPTSHGFIACCMRIKSAEGRRKAFGLVVSHGCSLSLFWTGIYMYLQPPSSTSKDWGKSFLSSWDIHTHVAEPPHLALEDMKEAFKRLMLLTFYYARSVPSWWESSESFFLLLKIVIMFKLIFLFFRLLQSLMSWGLNS